MIVVEEEAGNEEQAGAELCQAQVKLGQPTSLCKLFEPKGNFTKELRDWLKFTNSWTITMLLNYYLKVILVL
jgi:hypothetical protein